MRNRHNPPNLPSPLIAEALDDGLRVSLPEGPTATFLSVSVPQLTRRAAKDIIERADKEQRPAFVTYRQSSAEGRKALRDADISFAGEDGGAFVRAPGILVERHERRPLQRGPAWSGLADDDSARNPFAKRSSRIPRWLLLHQHESFSPSDLADAVDLNHASVSRIVRALEDSAWIDEQRASGSRRRRIRLARPRGVLDAWLPLWQMRRIRRLRWDIGARDADEAVKLVTDALSGRPWAIGGLAGAAMLRRVVEPADVLVWADEADLPYLEEALQAEPTRARRGSIRVAAAPDPWTLELAQPVDGLRVADPVQLWLDCASEGERALEAADAVAEAAGWS